jgi:hypothetical protein
MRGAIPPLPQNAFMVWCSVKAQGQLYFYFTFTGVLGGDPKGKNFLYTNGNNVIIRNIGV